MERDEERIARLSRALAEANLDALCCRLPHNVLMLTGYWPMLGTATALLTRAGEIALILPEDEWELARRGWVAEDWCIPFTPVTLEQMGNAEEATRPLLADLGRRLDLARAAIGYEGCAELTPAPYVALHAGQPSMPDLCARALPDATLWDASSLLATQRAALTARERPLVARVCAIAAYGFAAAAAAIRPGIREVDVAATVRGAIERRGLGALDVERVLAHAFCMSGPRAAHANRSYALTADRRIDQGDLVLVHVNACVDGFWTDLTRTYVLGEPNRQQLTMFEAVFEARGRAFRAIRAGVRASGIDTAARDCLKRAGYGEAFTHQLGHGVGYGAIYHGNLPRLHPCSDDVLTTGMTCNVEPAIYIEGMGGMRHCDVVTVSADGMDLLSPFQCSIDDLILAVGDADARRNDQYAGGR